MKVLAQTLIFAFVFVLIASAVPSDDGKLSGTVTDTFGGLIPNSYILVRRDPIASAAVHESNTEDIKDLNLHADSLGAYSVDVAPGFYDVFVSSPGFYPSCQKIRVRKNQDATFSPKLEVSTMLSTRVD